MRFATLCRFALRVLNSRKSVGGASLPKVLRPRRLPEAPRYLDSNGCNIPLVPTNGMPCRAAQSRDSLNYIRLTGKYALKRSLDPDLGLLRSGA
jgi:hypothetical protein